MQLRPRAIKLFKESHEPVSKLGDIVDKIHLCHQINLIHGDVRLSNILVYNDGVILADFGCALHVGEVSVFLEVGYDFNTFINSFINF
jgi:tRNA A-37 threonylcarbamoyl transferase component Bud32